MKVLSMDSMSFEDAEPNTTRAGQRSELGLDSEPLSFTMNVLSSNTFDARIRIAMPSILPTND